MLPPTPKSTMSLPVVTIKKEAKRGKTKIGVGSIVTVKVGGFEEKTREGRIRRTRKDS